MKMRTAAAFLFLVSSTLVQAQNNSTRPTSGPAASPKSSGAAGATQTPSERQSSIDPAKEADIRRLMDRVGTKAIALQSMDAMLQNMKPMIENALPPGEYRGKLVDLFIERFRSKADSQVILNMTVQIYDKYFSDDEIKSLIQFYETPLGQKTLSVLPKLMLEMQEEGSKWGQKIGRDSMMEVLSEHPELQKALEEAKKAGRPE
jgi:hypothetical protein